MENIPEEITELILDKSYEHLSDNEKILIAEFMDKQEYNELKSAYQLLDSMSIPSNSINETKRKKALTMFDKHQPKTIALWQQAIPIWQAACAACFVMILWLVHWQSYIASSPINSIRIDTVYIEKEIPVKVYDTVYIKQISIETKREMEREYSAIPMNNFTHIALITRVQKRQNEGALFYANKLENYNKV